ncbi:hydroxymethylbilane synthase [Archaeoglobus veneficus]|uniref:Probable porphobilinogen deaminase n=1 Tax=Archaeoglobus veneficus (strain DSM 11195 / SNP6) TaxID=693661 RepID=F2KQ99_ARCVS|nr:hydroxymethylbilane synthase [Archaeoglobus veneficus]AEA46532.1 Porphobilinogen deaminase [Archaeoglobus veneficus SNP6]
MPEKIVVGTRGSKLALAQTEKVIAHLKAEGYEVEIRIIKTPGDIMKDRPLHEFKGMGAFVRVIDEALVDGDIDIAVHSYKDVPSKINGVIAAVLERESPCDAFVTREGLTIDELESYSVVGTSSLRRRAQIKRYRPDLKIENLRGNVDTRLRKLREKQYDAILLAEAGLIRLGLNEKVRYQSLNPEIFVPSANQGIIAVETRKGEEDLVSFMNHKRTAVEAEVERAVLKELGVGCAVPVGIYAKFDGKIRLYCEVLSHDGSRAVRVEETLSPKTAIEEAIIIARELKKECGGMLVG